MKKCKRCKSSLPLSEFHRNKNKPDGRFSICKKCRAVDTAKYRDENRAKLRAKDRERGKLEKRKADLKISASKIDRKSAAIRYREKNPKKHAAHQAVACAKHRGKLIPMPCEVCGNKEVEAHHDDYNKKLDVRWLCREHHLEWHVNNEPIL